MKLITIYGASDDLVEIEGDIPGADEYGCYKSSGLIHGRIELESKSFMARIWIYCIYDGCWHFSFGMAEEGDAYPQWPIKTEWDGYTAKHTIEVPDDTTCKFEENPK